MGKDASFIHGLYKTWLRNTALLALICAAFAAGIPLGPIVSSRGKDDLKEVRRSPDSTLKQESASSKCISRKELATFMSDWSQSLDDFEEKMVNVCRGKINPATRKLSRARDAATKKAHREMLNTLLANWTAKYSEHINKQLHVNVTDKVTMVTEQRPEGKKKPEVIEVDSPDPPTPDANTQESLEVRVFDRDVQMPDNEMMKMLQTADLESHGFKKEIISQSVSSDSGNATPVYEKRFQFLKTIECSRLREIDQELNRLIPGIFGISLVERMNKEINTKHLDGFTKCKAGLEVHFKNGRSGCGDSTKVGKRQKRDACTDHDTLCVWCFYLKSV